MVLRPVAMVLRSQTLLQSRLQVLPVTQLLGRVPHNLVHSELQQEVELLDFFIALNRFFHEVLCDRARHFSVLLRSLPQFLPLHRVACRCDIRCRLLREHVLDGEDFVEQLELLLGRLAVRVAHRLTVEL